MAEPTQTIITICAWCNRERIGPLVWRPVAEPTFNNVNPLVTHTICPACKTEQLRQLITQPVAPCALG